MGKKLAERFFIARGALHVQDQEISRRVTSLDGSPSKPSVPLGPLVGGGEGRGVVVGGSGSGSGANARILFWYIRSP